MTSNSIRKIAIVGGTHGNELTGVYAIEKLARFPERLRQYCFEVVTLLANPQAVAANRRYLDRDLNRSFDNNLCRIAVRCIGRSGPSYVVIHDPVGIPHSWEGWLAPALLFFLARANITKTKIGV